MNVMKAQREKEREIKGCVCLKEFQLCEEKKNVSGSVSSEVFNLVQGFMASLSHADTHCYEHINV